jgi:hypothetical protein
MAVRVARLPSLWVFRFPTKMQNAGAFASRGRRIIIIPISVLRILLHCIPRGHSRRVWACLSCLGLDSSCRSYVLRTRLKYIHRYVLYRCWEYLNTHVEKVEALDCNEPFALGIPRPFYPGPSVQHGLELQMTREKQAKVIYLRIVLRTRCQPPHLCSEVCCTV